METFRRYSKRIYTMLCDAVYSKRHTMFKATGRLIFLRFFKVPLRAEELFFPLFARLFFHRFSPFQRCNRHGAEKSAYKNVRVYFFLEINFPL